MAWSSLQQLRQLDDIRGDAFASSQVWSAIADRICAQYNMHQ
jgi:hypothetical protein